MGEDAPKAAESQILEEDAARANLYALVGRLFYDAPDAIFLAEICREAQGSEESEGPLAEAWRALRDAGKTAYPVVIKQEYDTLFVGVGRAEVTPYTSHYVPGAADHHLVRLREQLAAWGLARRGNAFEMEDHVSGVIDVMRFLIEEQHPLADQQRFFESFVYPGAIPFFAAVRQTPSADFYKPVAAFAQAFLEVEKAAFDMGDLV